MTDRNRFVIKRRFFLQAAVLSALSARSMANSCYAPYTSPDAALPMGPFDGNSTADQVVAQLDLRGTTAVVSGCNSGLGLESMRALTSRGATVIGTARNAEKAEKACAAFGESAIPVVLELSDWDSARACAASITAMNKPIDMLICNAGIMALPELRLANGIELQFAVNHLGHFVFTNGLIESIKRADQGRIVMVSSCAHNNAPEVGIDFDNLDGSQSYEAWTAYGRSKLANGLYAAELARRLKDTGVTANSLHPGVIQTNLGRHLDTPARDPNDPVYNKDIAQGAATQCYVAAHPTAAPISGQYFADCNPATANPLMYDEDLAARLWQVSEQLTG
ncbi:MAG: SDR family NAD(P)-dependent oxidoreductase [Halieaceae bacterium]